MESPTEREEPPAALGWFPAPLSELGWGLGWGQGGGMEGGAQVLRVFGPLPQAENKHLNWGDSRLPSDQQETETEASVFKFFF